MKRTLKITAVTITLLVFTACKQDNKSPHGVKSKPLTETTETTSTKKQEDALKPVNEVNLKRAPTDLRTTTSYKAD